MKRKRKRRQAADKSIRSTVPRDRLTRVSDALLDAFRNHAETTDGDRAIVFLFSKDKRGGIGMTGYESDNDALVDLFVHLRAIMRANGKDLHLVPVGTTPPGERA